MTTTSDRAAAWWLREPEATEACVTCGNAPCTCDHDYDQLMDHLDWIGAES